MRSRFDEQLALLNREMIKMGALCEEAIALAAKALTEGDAALAAKVAPLGAEIDQMERDIYAEFHVPLCVHMDPVAEPDAHIKAAEDALRAYLAQYDPPMTLHDFRFVPGEKQTNLIFDVDAPPSFRGQVTLGEQLKAQARALDARFHCIIRFDTNYYN